MIDEKAVGDQCECRSPFTDCTSLKKNISQYPVPCLDCLKQHSIQEDGPDAGIMFACGIMVENMEAGCMNFDCSWQEVSSPAQSVMIDAETANAAMKLRAMADAIEPGGFNPRQWLAARGL